MTGHPLVVTAGDGFGPRSIRILQSTIRRPRRRPPIDSHLIGFRQLSARETSADHFLNPSACDTLTNKKIKPDE
jgi:hypothetical protein